MISELEKQFFDRFGIEPKRSMGLIKIKEPSYPQITDRILLELICIINDFEGIYIKSITVNALKEELLKQAIEHFKYPIAFEEHYEVEKLYHKIQALFKED